MKTLQVDMTDNQHRKVKSDAAIAGETMTDYTKRKLGLMDDYLQAKVCSGHSYPRSNCGFTGCKY